MRIMRTLELSISLTSIKDKKGAVIQQANKRVPGMVVYRADMLLFLTHTPADFWHKGQRSHLNVLTVPFVLEDFYAAAHICLDRTG